MSRPVGKLWGSDGMVDFVLQRYPMLMYIVLIQRAIFLRCAEAPSGLVC